MAEREHESNGSYIEAIYYAGGLKSKLYGSEQRDPQLPAPERVGLQNDIFLRDGQWVVDISSFQAADGSLDSTVSWIGTYTHAVDVYGDRGNFCGVGLWLARGTAVDTAKVLEVLFAISEVLRKNLPTDGLAALSPLVDANCVQALDFIKASCTVGMNIGKGGLIPAGHSAASSLYVTTNQSRDSAPVGLGGLLADILFGSPEPAASRVLFTIGDSVTIDEKVAVSARLSSAAALRERIGGSGLLRRILALLEEGRERDYQREIELNAVKRQHDAEVESMLRENDQLRQELSSQQPKPVVFDELRVSAPGFGTSPTVEPPRQKHLSFGEQSERTLRDIADRLTMMQRSISMAANSSAHDSSPAGGFVSSKNAFLLSAGAVVLGFISILGIAFIAWQVTK